MSHQSLDFCLNNCFLVAPIEIFGLPVAFPKVYTFAPSLIYGSQFWAKFTKSVSTHKF